MHNSRRGLIGVNYVSMKSGLEGRNNPLALTTVRNTKPSLNEVRPRRPEQLLICGFAGLMVCVSMKSGLEGRNNLKRLGGADELKNRLNEVRPRRPEQYVSRSRGCKEENRSQ